jgi:hypothetical protein
MSREYIKKTRDWLLENIEWVTNDLTLMDINVPTAMYLHHKYIQTVRAFIGRYNPDGVPVYTRDGQFLTLL